MIRFPPSQWKYFPFVLDYIYTYSGQIRGCDTLPAISGSAQSAACTRRLALHSSALSNTEHALFTASLADLADTSDLEYVSVNVREARAWFCGRYAALGSGTVDEILRLFAPATTLSSGAFFAALRLVVHGQAGCGVDRRLAFLQAPVPATPIPTPINPFLPMPAPSSEAPARPPLPPFLDIHVFLLVGAALKDTSLALSLALPRRRAHSTALLPADITPAPRLGAAHLRFVPPTHPTLRQPPSKSRTRTKSRTITKPLPLHPPPRRASVSLSVPASPAPPPVRVADPSSAGPRTMSFAPPSVHAQRRASAFEPAYGAPTSPSHTTYAAHNGWRVTSDSAPVRRPSSSSSSSSYASELTRSPARERTASTSVLPLTLPKALRRTLAGVGWVGAERGEREGLVRGANGGGYTGRSGRRGAEGGGREDGDGMGMGMGMGMGEMRRLGGFVGAR
ncbi:hypothetical protein B0H17DRAFT_1144972 [Mycena rosella]|uniref:Uncharacterized protein n=1 Tax=Mycena rosella TaxID=1033263 RepID=A0AAD7CRK6_MYCRO|nr:hypothetical protein B0H17DRAFT_1144972 [Mycena rosella]